MNATLTHMTPATGMPSSAAARCWSAPNTAVQGTGLPFAGTYAFGKAAVAGVRSIDLPGSPPRGAPV